MVKSEFRLVTEQPFMLGFLPEGWLNFFVDCDHCHREIKVDYYWAPPKSFSCPFCEQEVVIYKCLHCGVHFEEGDQGFLVVDVPYGSSVWDCMYGPAYFCSSAHMVEAFKNDEFQAKAMFAMS